MTTPLSISTHAEDDEHEEEDETSKRDSDKSESSKPAKRSGDGTDSLHATHDIVQVTNELVKMNQWLSRSMTSIQEKHGATTDAVKRMNDTWQATRNEIRDERRDMQVTLEHLAKQVVGAKEELLWMLSNGEGLADDLGWQAMDMVELEQQVDEPLQYQSDVFDDVQVL